ncbi:hypothetical protein ACJX0J_023837, partial [Zea mays]
FESIQQTYYVICFLFEFHATVLVAFQYLMTRYIYVLYVLYFCGIVMMMIPFRVVKIIEISEIKNVILHNV